MKLPVLSRYWYSIGIIIISQVLYWYTIQLIAVHSVLSRYWLMAEYQVLTIDWVLTKSIIIVLGIEMVLNLFLNVVFFGIE